MFGTLIDYWRMTGDDTYNDITLQAIVHQAGEDRDFMPRNQTSTMGNDDQGFWALTAMSAAEGVFPNPPSDQPQYLALVQATFNLYVSRWETKDCGGGLRWQIWPLHDGYYYKNTISNGCFFNIAARLARYTKNDTYLDWAEKVYDWQTDIGLIRPDFSVEDGAGIQSQCEKRTPVLWSYNTGIFIHGAAVMYSITESDEWKERLDGLLKHAVGKFFKDKVAFEQQCEPRGDCNNDQRSFKGYLLRFLAATAQLAPHTADTILPLLRASGEAAAKSCEGSPPADQFRGMPGTACGQDWLKGKFDDIAGVGEQMNGLAGVQYTLVEGAKEPATADKGGTSKSDPGAGEDSVHKFDSRPITAGDRAGAAILTALACIGVVMGCAYVLI